MSEINRARPIWVALSHQTTNEVNTRENAEGYR